MAWFSLYSLRKNTWDRGSPALPASVTAERHQKTIQLQSHVKHRILPVGSFEESGIIIQFVPFCVFFFVCLTHFCPSVTNQRDWIRMWQTSDVSTSTKRFSTCSSDDDNVYVVVLLPLLGTHTQTHTGKHLNPPHKWSNDQQLEQQHWKMWSLYLQLRIHLLDHGEVEGVQDLGSVHGDQAGSAHLFQENVWFNVTGHLIQNRDNMKHPSSTCPKVTLTSGTFWDLLKAETESLYSEIVPNVNKCDAW